VQQEILDSQKSKNDNQTSNKTAPETIDEVPDVQES
jgi:hypothetical protein